MASVILTLGGVPFQDMEVPEAIRFGGRQRVSVQNLIGGGRVVAPLGLDDGEISFSGIFSGADAVSRAQELDAARALGAQLPLIWDGFFYTVLIEGFSAEYRKPNLIPFTIACVVVTDPVSSLANGLVPVASLVAGDLASALGFSSLAGVSLQGLTATSLAGFATVQGILSGNISALGGVLAGTGVALNNAGTASAGVAVVERAQGTSAQLAGVTAMQGYVSRAATNLESII